MCLMEAKICGRSDAATPSASLRWDPGRGPSRLYGDWPVSPGPPGPAPGPGPVPVGPFPSSLRALITPPNAENALRRLARVLQPGFYHPAIVEGTVRLIEPGAPADYFASDVVRLSGPDARSVRILIPCSGRAVVVPQKPAQPLAATNVSAIARERFWRDQVVAEPLMVPLPMVVRYELVEDADQAPFPEKNQAVETLLANRAHEPFRVSVGIRRLEGR